MPQGSAAKCGIVVVEWREFFQFLSCRAQCAEELRITSRKPFDPDEMPFTDAEAVLGKNSLWSEAHADVQQRLEKSEHCNGYNRQQLACDNCLQCLDDPRALSVSSTARLNRCWATTVEELNESISGTLLDEAGHCFAHSSPPGPKALTT